jgi:two-component system chemotaxis response regulator CheY
MGGKLIKIERTLYENRSVPGLRQKAKGGEPIVVSGKQLEKLIERLGLLVVDENPYTRKLTRMMLMNIGAKSIFEAADGLSALDVIRNVNPDIMLMDWDIPVLSGPQIMHIVRSPGVFAKPLLPIIMLTPRASRTRVNEAIRLGVHEVLTKPTSPKMLQDRLLSILVNPRPMVQVGKYLVPEPRRLAPGNDVAPGNGVVSGKDVAPGDDVAPGIDIAPGDDVASDVKKVA